MSATGLDVFDKTFQTTNIWLNEIMDDLGPDRKRAYHALRAVLHALRDRLTLDEAAHLGAQLPTLVRGIYYDQWRPHDVPVKERSQEEFLSRVAEGLQNIRPMDIGDATHTVFKVIERHVDRGEIEQVKRMLPEDVRRLWPQGTA
ncbi:MAG TPA: DUF2267 domain-containing protein [Alphaproteobacteria bacterium]|nr:DUF2267 domain-containing protein [Alphaproteobacteria bacterium]